MSEEQNVAAREISLGDKVIINANGIAGIVKAVYQSLYSAPQFDVEYKDANGALFTKFFFAEELSLT
jgi:hypothetical protein